MKNLPKSIEEKFYAFIYGDINLESFESWVYTENDLEAALSADDYLDLISFNYKKIGAKDELIEFLFGRFIDRAKYERWMILELLYIAKKGDERLPDVLRLFYDLYCRDYNFLRDLGLGYGLMIEVPPGKYKADTWEEMS